MARLRLLSVLSVRLRRLNPRRLEVIFDLESVLFVKCEQVLTVAKERLVGKLGVIGKDEMQLIKQAVRLVLEVG